MALPASTRKQKDAKKFKLRLWCLKKTKIWGKVK